MKTLAVFFKINENNLSLIFSLAKKLILKNQINLIHRALDLLIRRAVMSSFPNNPTPIIFNQRGETAQICFSSFFLKK